MDLGNSGNFEGLEWLFSSPQVSGQWFFGILDSIYNGVLIVDERSIVRHINPEYTRITGVTKEQIIGKFLSDVRPGAMLPQVVRTGKPMGGVYRREGAVEYVVDMAPIFVGGKIAGGISIVKDITEVRRLSKEIAQHEKRAIRLKTMVEHAFRAKYRFDDVIGTSTKLTRTVGLAKKIAAGDADVLITGDSGTGKEVFAQAIHNASTRASGPFIAVNCASLTPTLLESELFGYEDGAFTGARKGGKPGLFEVADGGTIFLDEIGELSVEAQAKLLRVLQERSVRKIGEATEIPLNVRVITASNRDLRLMMKEGRLREDLYYRLNVVNIQLPSLRERGEDSSLLADHILGQFARKTGRAMRFSAEVYDVFRRYDWPGNVRELRNAVEFAANICEGGLITDLHLPTVLLKEAGGQPERRTLADIVKKTERQVLLNCLQGTGFTVEGKRRAAEQLGISLATLYNKLKALGIEESGGNGF